MLACSFELTHSLVVTVRLFRRDVEFLAGLWGVGWHVRSYDRHGHEVDRPVRWWNVFMVDWKRGEYRHGSRTWKFRDSEWLGWRGVACDGYLV